MKEITQEKSLVKNNENGRFYKIKKFFKNLFNRNNNMTTDNNSIVKEIENRVKNEKNKNSFIEDIKNIEDEEIKLLELQKQYRSGEIKEEELTQEQITELCALYDRQIAYLKKSNEHRMKKLLEYSKKSK